MKVSIITPTYNGAAFIAQTLNSVAAQSFANWEHIIVDDGSVDKTLDVVQAFAQEDPRILLFESEHSGVAMARNLGYLRADTSSDFVIFLDHDDCWYPDTLERLAAALQESPDMLAAYGLAHMTDLNGNPVEDISPLLFSHQRRRITKSDDGYRIACSDPLDPTTFESMICNCAVPTPGLVLLRRGALESIREDYGYFDPTVGSGNDWDAWIRLTLKGPMKFVDDILIDWRHHENNGTKDKAETWDAGRKVRYKMMNLPELTDDQRMMATWRYETMYGTLSNSPIPILSGAGRPIGHGTAGKFTPL